MGLKKERWNLQRKFAKSCTEPCKTFTDQNTRTGELVRTGWVAGGHGGRQVTPCQGFT